MKIAILQNDVKQIDAITDTLDHAGHQVDVFFNRSVLDSQLLNFDLIILNFDKSFIRDIRINYGFTLPLITWLENENLISDALFYGATDYFIDGEEIFEIIQRIKPYIARDNSDCSSIFLGESNSIKLDGVKVQLTKEEFRLAHFLYSHLNRPLKESHLMMKVWGVDYPDHVSDFDRVVSGLKSKLVGTSNACKLRLMEIKGYGYRLIEDTAS
jgi:DNA-binding response OmpR family regulator